MNFHDTEVGGGNLTVKTFYNYFFNVQSQPLLNRFLKNNFSNSPLLVNNLNIDNLLRIR